MPPSTAQLQQENQRLKSRCETLETELTELQQRYQSLGRSEARYRQVVENSPISISFLSADGQHVEANAAFERMMGFTVEDSQRVGFNVFTDPALAENGTRPYMLRAMAGETVIEPPTNFYDASQLYGKGAVENYTPGQGHYFPIWNEDGEVQEIVEMAPVVTGLLQAQAEAQAEREHAATERAKLLSTVAQVANLLLRSQDYTTVISDVVRLLGEAVGCDRCTFLQGLPEFLDTPNRVRMLNEWHQENVPSVLKKLPEEHPDIWVEPSASFLQKILHGETVNFITSELLEPDWRVFFEEHHIASLLIVPIMLSEGYWGDISFHSHQDPQLFNESDIAILQVAAESIAAAIERQRQDQALRDSEKRFRTLFELSSEGIYYAEVTPPCPVNLSFDKQCEWLYENIRVTSANPAFVAMYGAENAEELVGLTNADVHVDDSEKNTAFIRGIVENQYQFQGLETEEVDQQGDARYFLNNATGITENGHVLGFWATQTDVTELRQTQQALLEAEQARAQELEQFNAELQQALERLQARDRVLNATTESVAAILTDSQFDRSIDNALAIIGASVDCDRVEVFQHIEDDTEQSLGVLRLLFEWYSSHASPQQAHPTLTEITHAGLEGLWSCLRAGECLTGPIESYPEPFRSGQIELGVQSTHAVPIFVGGQYWGIVAIDHCREQRQLTPMELSVFKIAATCIGSAIERDRAAQERVNLLSTVAQIANLLLRSQDYTTVLPDVVRLLGEAVGSDRCAVTQEMLGSADHLPRVRLLNEWHREGVPSVLQGSPEFGPGVEIDLPPIFHQSLLRGEAVNFTVAEVEEPAWRDFFEAHHNVSMLIVPVMLADGCWGHIGFDNCQNANPFDEAEIAILQVAAESIAAAIERQHQDEALRESEQRYRTLFELSSEGIYRFELEPPLSLALSPEDRLKLGYQVNQIVETNQAFAEQYGFDMPEDLMGTKIGDFYDHEYSQTNDRVNVDLMRDLRVSKIETIETDRLGNRHWFLSSVVCDVRDDVIVGGWGVQTDITELKQAQQSLLEAEQARAIELERYNVELQQALEHLQARDRVLQATATAADALLTTGSLEEAVNTALQIIGESLDTDRIAVLENEPYETVSDLSQVKWELLYEWHSSHIFSQLQSPNHKQGTFAGIETWPERLAQGESISYPLEALPEPFRSTMAEVGVKSIHEVPIFVEGKCWGALGIDDCRETKHRDPAELAVLKTAAACIGSAIERDRTQQAILQAEQERARELEQFNIELQQALERLQARDLILEATAEATNALLSMESLDDAVDAALEIMGESLDTDRINIIEIAPFDADSNLSQVRWKVLNDWSSPHTVSQRLHPNHNQGDHTGIEDWLALFSSGQSASFLLEEMPEPFRSSQAELGVEAYHTVPIFLAGRYWGNLGIDDCREAKHRDPAELSVLNTIAACIGSAIERDRTQKAILAAEQAKAQELQCLNTELQTSLDDIRNRDFIAETAATVANVLLREDTLQSAITQALGFLGKALSLDRVAIIEISAPSPDISSVMWHVSYEWDSPATISQINNSRLAQGTFEGIETLYEQMSSGQVISCLLEELPEPFRSGQAELGVKTLHDVPIFVADEFWGAIGFDDCHQAKRLSQTELSMLKIAADCIGSAIERNRTQKAILQTEKDRSHELEQFNTQLQQTLEQLQARDRILELTANSANTLLTTDSVETAVITALQMIGERLGTDRVNVIENIAPEPGADFPSWRVLYEWDSSGTVPQLSHPETAQGSYGDIQWLYERFQSHRQSVSYNIEDAPEPFRSQQMAIGVKATHIVPIFIDETWWGVVAMDDCQTVQTRDPAELSVLKTAAACIGSAIQRDRTQQTLLAAEQNRVVELAKTNQALKNSLDRLADNPDLDAFLGYVLTEISQQFDGKIATLYHFDPYTQTLNLQQWVEQGVVLTREDLHQFGPMAEPISAVGSTAWDFLLENKFPLVITRDNARQYMFPGTQDWQLEWANRENLQAGINILLSSGQPPLGMLCVFSAKRSEFTSEELEIAQALSHQATLAIQLTRLAAEAQQAAILGERNRLAREIHDTLAQAFGGVLMQLQAADYFSDSRPEMAWNHIKTAQKLSQDGLDKARRSVWTLYLESTEYEDLAGAIRQFIAEKQTNTAATIDLKIDGSPYSLQPELGLNLLRIAQEAIANALRHAQARVIEVSLSYTPDYLRLTIADDGQGFSTESPSNGFGLIGMQQRANKIEAQLQLTSQPQGGTQITVTLRNPMAF